MPWDWYDEAQKEANKREHFTLEYGEGNRCWLIFTKEPGKVNGSILARCDTEQEAVALRNKMLSDFAKQHNDHKEV